MEEQCDEKIWNLPNTAHCSLLPLLCGCLPFHDEICRRLLNFVYKCMFSAVDVVRSVAHYAVMVEIIHLFRS